MRCQMSIQRIMDAIVLLLAMFLVSIESQDAGVAIIGGTTVNKRVNFIVGIIGSDGIVNCAGVLVETKFAITTAECCANKKDIQKIGAGGDSSASFKQSSPVELRIGHQRRVNDSPIADICLIKFKKAFNLNKDVGLAKLQGPGTKIGIGTPINVYGFGRTKKVRSFILLFKSCIFKMWSKKQ